MSVDRIKEGPTDVTGVDNFKKSFKRVQLGFFCFHELFKIDPLEGDFLS